MLKFVKKAENFIQNSNFQTGRKSFKILDSLNPIQSYNIKIF